MPRGLRFEVVSLLLNIGALAGVVLAIAMGAAPHRLWRVADFLFVGSVAATTFESDGLRVYLPKASFLVRWNAIAAVSSEGPEGRKLIHLRIQGIGEVMASVEPDTLRTRSRVSMIVRTSDPPAGTLTLMPWTAGLDGPVLARAINAAVDRRLGRVH